MQRMSLVALMLAALTGCMSNSDDIVKPQPEKASDINLELGIDYLRKGNLSAAKEKIERALDQNPRNANAHATAGLLFDRLGDQKKAESHFDRAISIDSENPDISNNYAAFLCKNGRYERGEKFAALAGNNPLYKTPEMAFVNAGNCARAGGDLKKAEEHYRRALGVNPRYPTALIQLATVENEQKEFLSARAFLERYWVVARPSAASLWLGVRIERGLNNAGTADAYAKRMKNDYPAAPETRELLQSERNPG